MANVTVASDWTQFQSDWKNKAIATGPAITHDPELVWAFHTSEYDDNGISVPPVISGNFVYVLTTNGSLWAFEKHSGDLVWDTKVAESAALQSSTPAIGNGKIFVATSSGDLVALDSVSGDILWEVDVTEGNFACPVTYYDHRIYVGDGIKGGIGDKYYYCYDEDGNEIWKHVSQNSVGFLWEGAVIVDNFIIYSTHEGKLLSINKDTGELIDELDLSSYDLSFSKEDPGMFRSSVTYSDGYIYTTSERGQSTGYVWKVKFTDGYFGNDGWCTPNGFSTSTPVIHEGKVYVGQGEHGYTGHLTCLDDASGEVLWSYFTDAGVKSSPVLAMENGMTYIYFTGAEDDGSLYCLTEAGDLAWEFDPQDSGYILQGASISDGMLYFGTDAGYLYCIRETVSSDWDHFHKDVAHTGFSPSEAPDTNDLLWTSENIGAVAGSSPVIADGRVFVNCGEFVSSLDLYTGEFLGNHSNGSTKYNSIASPAYSMGNVYCGLDDSVNSGSTIADGKRFEGVWDGYYYCFDEESGELIWNFTVAGNAQGTPAYDNGMVYLTSWEYGVTYQGHVYCVDAETGELVWSQDSIKNSCTSSPTIYGDTIYVTTFNFYDTGDLYAIDKGSGDVLWNRSIERTSSTPAVAYGNVYVAGGCYGYTDLMTYCFDADTGDLLWNTTSSDGIGGWLCSVAVADGKVFSGTALEANDDYTGLNGTCALDAFTGELLWNSPYGGSSPAVYDGVLFSIADGKVYAFGNMKASESDVSTDDVPGFESITALFGILLVSFRRVKKSK
ncbi:PQQ-binding-like beta-propeller repeat protein [Methanococcoides methylutens]|uniref:Cell surface protein n=1 Tax=Methanococcoides methylutens MM1 TaxID=1434104 RepID=A0A0E3X170_METMT|nr:PQQ-binding-like beta-propeller repeat protein [Methanococcoides methylutens]AKB85879.1 cell surface protein [Methanococcoides methylutens MM1]